MSLEESIVVSFVLRERQRRYLALLESKKGRMKFRAALAHFIDFDPRFVRAIPANQQTPRQIEGLLRRLGATDRCIMSSEADEFDGLELDLSAALARVVGQQWGTLLSCVPEALAYYEGEEPGDRFILHRNLAV